MVSSITMPSLDSSVLLSYYNAQLTTSVTSAVNAPVASRQPHRRAASSATRADNPPWSTYKQPAQEIRDAQVLGSPISSIPPNVPKSAGSTRRHQDRAGQSETLLALHGGQQPRLSRQDGQRDGITDGQRAGYDTRFQSGLAQVQDFIARPRASTISPCRPARRSPSVTSSVSVPFAPFTYQGGTIVTRRQYRRLRCRGVSTHRQFHRSRSRRAARRPMSPSTCRRSPARCRSTTSSTTPTSSFPPPGSIRASSA